MNSRYRPVTVRSLLSCDMCVKPMLQFVKRLIVEPVVCLVCREYANMAQRNGTHWNRLAFLKVNIRIWIRKNQQFTEKLNEIFCKLTSRHPEVEH